MSAEMQRPQTALGLAGQEMLKAAIGLVLSFGVVTGVLYYFGWARFSAILSAFNVPFRLMRYEPNEYVLASVSAVFYPMLTAIILLLAWLIVSHLLVRRYAVLRRAVKPAALIGGLLGLAAAVLSLLHVFPRTEFPWEPISLALGLIALSWYVQQASSNPPVPLLIWTVAGIVILLTFWWIALYGQYRGAQSAEAIQRDVNALPRVSFSTREPLGLPAEVAETLKEGTTVYVHKDYRLLAHSGDKMALLPPTWPQDRVAYLVGVEDVTLGFS
ncbi:MAG: hypothetical protein ACOYBY_16810 [Dermatophilaceae bacterium]